MEVASLRLISNLRVYHLLMTIPLYLHCLALPTPFPVGPVNVYLAEGTPLTLIDTGPKDDSTRAALEAGLKEHGYRMQRMAALEPLVALPGHGEVVNDMPGLVRQRLAFHKRRAQKILDALGARPLTLWELIQPIFPKLTRGMDFFLGLSEILGHLDLLDEAGTARPVCEGAQVRWTRV